MSQLDPEFVESFCDEAHDLLSQWETLCMTMTSDCSKDTWDALFRMAHNLKGTSKAVGLTDFGNTVHKIEDVITLAKDGAVATTKELIDWFLEGQSLLSGWVAQLRAKNYDSIDASEYLAVVQMIIGGGSVPAEAFAEEEPAAVVAPRPQAPEVSEAPVASEAVTEKVTEKTKKAPVVAAKGNETVRVGAVKLDEVLEIVGELSIHQTILWHARKDIEKTNPLAMNSIYIAKKLLRDLHEKTLSLRMQPLQNVFQRLERTIRDIAGTVGKDVMVKVYGSDVELDKLVCEKIVDPLTHMVRNAVDHGIEHAHDRIIDGKSEQGTVIIEAVQESNSVTISIRDDGKGLDPVRIFNKAVEKGLIDANEKLSENEILSLIFLPGFSTAEKLTDVSGRGVGMDVVMRSVEGLGGKVKIGSQVGKGTNFMISLPTSLSIVDALIFTLKGVRFAVPMNAIEEVLDISDGRLSDDVVMMKHQNRVIPVSSLASFLKMKPVAGASDVEGGAFIVRHEGKLAAFKFGDLLGEQQIVVRQLSPSLENTFGFSGATILGDGDPGLIVDMGAISAKFLKAFNMKESA